jgi:hypothetical protein
MREALIQSTHLKRHRDLFVRTTWYNNFMLKILLKLPVLLLKRIEVVEERVHAVKVIFWLLVRLNFIGSVDLILLLLLFLGVADDRTNTVSIG